MRASCKLEEGKGGNALHIQEYSRRLEVADIRGDVVFLVEIAPAKPMITEYLTGPVIVGG